MAASRSIRMSPFRIMSSNDGAPKPEQRKGESLAGILHISLYYCQPTQFGKFHNKQTPLIIYGENSASCARQTCICNQHNHSSSILKLCWAH
jgi:hypothetical protein